MTTLSRAASDEELIRVVDGWAQLLEHEDYAAAFRYTDENPAMGWTPETIRRIIKEYGEARPSQRVTVSGVPTDVSALSVRLNEIHVM